MNPSKLIIFDLETIPDIDSAKVLLNCDNEETKEEIREKLTNYHIEKSNNPFHRQMFHEIVCIGIIEVDILHNYNSEELSISRIKSICGEKSENDMIKSFISLLSQTQPKLITYNGKTFDIPVLKYRAMKHGIQAKILYENNRSYRYNLDYNCDLLEVFSDFGSSSRATMQEVASILNIPCKYDVKGSSVLELYDNNQFQEIADYCEIDCVVTYMLYLNHNLTSGKMNKNNYEQAINNLKEYMIKEDKEHFKKFLNLIKI